MTARPASVPRARRWRRVVEAAATVAVWIGLGWALALDANAYLVLGVPITVAFQFLIHRRPLHTLWVRDATAFRIDRRGVVLAGALAAAPTFTLLRGFSRRPGDMDWALTAWLLAAIVGAVGAAFSFRSFSRATLRNLLGCLAIVGALAFAIDLLVFAVRSGHQALTSNAAVEGVRSFVLYLPVAFVLEEVFFRGALDAHVYHQPESRGLMSAVFVSALWGLWHLPLAQGIESIWASALLLAVLHVILGVPLSLFWRRSGNLAVPAVAHAFASSLRNALLQQ